MSWPESSIPALWEWRCQNHGNLAFTESEKEPVAAPTGCSNPYWMPQTEGPCAWGRAELVAVRKVSA